jgi:hypothetical protein
MPSRKEDVFEAGELLQNFLSSGFATVPRTSCSLIRRDALLALAHLARPARAYPTREDQFLMWGVAMRWPVAAHPRALVKYRQRLPLGRRPPSRMKSLLKDEAGFLRVIRGELRRVDPRHPLLQPGGIPARLAALSAAGRSSPFGDYFFERIPGGLRRLCKAST